MHDVIISDAEFESASSTIKVACTKIDNMIDNYITILQKACFSGAVAGDTAKALQSYHSYAKRLKGMAVAFSQHHDSINSNFLNAVDATDSYLYE